MTATQSNKAPVKAGLASITHAELLPRVPISGKSLACDLHLARPF